MDRMRGGRPQRVRLYGRRRAGKKVFAPAVSGLVIALIALMLAMFLQFPAPGLPFFKIRVAQAALPGGEGADGAFSAASGFGGGSRLFKDMVGVNHFLALSEAADGEELDLAAQLGYGYVRTEMVWPFVEQGEKGAYDFEAYDRLVEQIASRGMAPLFVLSFGNALYGEQFGARSAAAQAAYARFAAAAAARFPHSATQVIWELGNEPNNKAFWQPEPRPAEYAALAVKAAKAIREADPGAVIIGPSTLLVDYRYLEECFKRGLLSYVDAVSVHPYRSDPPESVFADYRRLRELIGKYCPRGRKVEVVVSEWGYTAAGPGGEKRQAEYLPRMFLGAAMEGIPLLVWYDFRNDGPDSSEVEQNFGIMTQNFAPKPVFDAMREMMYTVGELRFERRFRSDPRDYILLFSDPGQARRTVLAAWTVGPEHAVILANGDRLFLSGQPVYRPVNPVLRERPEAYPER